MSAHHDGSECADFEVEHKKLEAEMDKLHNRVCELSAENRELVNEVLVGLADTTKLTQEIQALKKRDSVQAYEKLGAENLMLLGRVRELEAALFAANEEITDLRVELQDAEIVAGVLENIADGG